MKPITIVVYLYTFILVYCGNIYAQNRTSFEVKRYTIFDGLSNNWITDIHQDEDGFLWFATQYGINRFDGKNFKKFTYKAGDSSSLKGNWVRSISQLKDGKIGIGTFGGGVMILDPYQEKFTELKILPDTIDYNSNVINKTKKLITDKGNNIWISGLTGTFRFNIADSTLTSFYTKGTDNISISSDGTILILGKKKYQNLENQQDQASIFRVMNDSIKRISYDKDINDILNMLSISKDSLLIYKTNELLIQNHKGDSVFRKKLNFESTYKSSLNDRPFIFKDKKNRVWVNGGDKVYRFSSNYQKRDVITLGKLLGLPPTSQVRANCMFQDNEDNYWIGTNLGAFQLIKHKPFHHPILGKVGQVREIIDCDDQVWFALTDGVYRWDRNSSNPIEKINNHTIYAMTCGSDGFVYIFASDTEKKTDLIKINPHNTSEEYFYFQDLEFTPSDTWSITEDKNQRLWIAQWDNIIIHDLKNQSYFGIPLFSENTGVIDLYYDKLDNMWIGSLGKGLLKITNASEIKKGTNYTYTIYEYNPKDPNSISSNLVQSIAQDEKGTLWIGTDGGLNSLDIETKKFKRFLRSEEMPNDKILNVISDKKGKLWLGTISDGILSYDIESGQFDNFMTTDGLYDNSMLIGSAHIDKNDFIWMGSESGLQYFHPDKLVSSIKKSPNMIWESYTKFRADTTLHYKFPSKNKLGDKKIEIYPEDQSINFKFRALTFEKQDKVRYQFKLGNYHKDWLPPQKDGDLRLSYIPKGKYQLKVKATFEDQQEAMYTAIPIVVYPVWYKTNFAYILYSLLAAAMIWLIYRIQLRRKIAEAEREYISDLSKVKSRWFNLIAHEFRTPLTVILGATDQIKAKLKHQKISLATSHLNQIEDQTNHLSNQVQKILEIAQMQDKQLDMQLDNGDFIAFQKYLFQSFTSLAKQKNLELKFITSHQSIFASYDEDKWKKITYNLISNAIKYNKIGGTITLNIAVDVENAMVNLSVTDTGVGISKPYVSRLFEPFSKESPGNAEGVGLGLTLTRELVQLLGGTIGVQSKKNKGSTFVINAPIDLLINEDDKPVQADFIAIEDNSNPIVLIAEDHKEVRDYIKFCLEDNFFVLEAKNGLDAWKLCKKHIPDLVISDITMPNWDGIRLGTEIRKHVETDHIPFILLTAKSGQANQLEGLKIGAEAYLTKPFDRNELLVRVNNLISTRKKLQQKYQSGDVTITPNHKVIDQFMKKVIETIKKELDNDEFGVPQLAENLNISRVHLYRKLKNLTGLSPTKFIRKIRLQKAEELIIKNELSISEIAYMTGFKDPAYFTRVYVEEFGKPPSDFRK
ncbi:hybrid sensor histidine kinase/response regulator [Aquimarina brevivitae]|uniref:histidine kinase n=1 Tax=Aquimarina brevivitae TaxID=323412 RepID=A0A4Q7PGC2_9FLAO|nr:two-component regulator propeller domain-containing protein [Aquimarina brevivitae]RZS99554.1 two component regulator with propeller domain [Aquimarina brevivitae]